MIPITQKYRLILAAALLLIGLGVGLAVSNALFIPTSAAGESGTWGASAIPWSIDASEGLVIGDGGTATIDNTATSAADYPWDAYRSQITSVSFNGTITVNNSLEYAFSDMPALSEIDFRGLNTGDDISFAHMLENDSALTALDLNLSMTGSSGDTNMLAGLSSLLSITVYMNTQLTTACGLDMTHALSRGTRYSEDTTYETLADWVANIGANPGQYDYVVFAYYNVGTGEEITPIDRVIRAYDPIYGSEVTLISEADVFDYYAAPAGNMFYRWMDQNGTLRSGGDSIYIFEDMTFTAQWVIGYGDYTDLTDHLPWLITSEGELQIGDATAAFTTFPYSTYRDSADIPWLAAAYIDQIRSARFMGTVNSNGSMANLLAGCTNLTSVDFSGLDNSDSNGEFSSLFNGCTSLTSADLSGFDAGQSYALNMAFTNCTNLQTADLSGLTLNMANNMFEGCSSLTSVTMNGTTTTADANITYMFSGCSALTSVDVTGFDTSNMTALDAVFAGCSSLTQLDVSSFATGAVTSFTNMFQNCSGLTSLDVTGFDTSSGMTFTGMFDGCSGLTELDVTGFNTINGAYFNNMFSGCTSLETLDISGMNLPAGADGSDMLSGLDALTELTLGTDIASGMADMNFDNASLWSADLATAYLAADLVTAYDADPAGMAATYYAVWMVSFDPGTGTGTADDVYVRQNDNVYVLPDCPATFTAPAGATFYKWDNSGIEQAAGEEVRVDANITVTAMWGYTITFVDEDGVTELDSQVLMAGTTPVYAGTDPAKAADAQYTYTFSGWDPAIAVVSEAATYTAVYTATVNTYVITFYDEDSTTVLETQTLEYGATPVYGGAALTKDSDDEYSYAHTGWTPGIATVTGTASYTVVYTATAHVWADPVWTWSADHNSASAVFTCGDCSYSRTITATVTSAVTAEATCEMNGTKIWTATATISGTDYTDSYAEAIPATGHNPGEWIYDGGSHWRVCGYCGQILEQAAHLSASGATETEAEVCLVCGYVMTPALGHVHAWHLTYTPAKAATCTQEGVSIAHYRCECGFWSYDAEGLLHVIKPTDVVIAPLGHAFDDTWTSDAYGHWHVCTRCGIAVEGYEQHISGGPATVEHTENCAVCGHLLGDPLIIKSYVYYRETGDMVLEDVEFTQLTDDGTLWKVELPSETPTRAESWFEGWMSSMDGELYQPGEELTYSFSGAPDVTFTAIWTRVIGIGTYDLEGNTKYRFGEGTFRMQGDPTVYGGEQFFYLSADGNYTILGGE